MFTNKHDPMHFYFAKYDHEIAIVALGLDVDNVQQLSGDIPVYDSFDVLPDDISSVAVVVKYPINETLLPQEREISYIFIGIGLFITPSSKSVISLCVEDNQSLQSIFEAICASEENNNVFNIDPLEPDLNGKIFRHITDISIDSFDSCDFETLAGYESLWFHQRSLHSFESITKFNGHISELSNYFCHSGIHTDQANMVRVIEMREPSTFPWGYKYNGVAISFKVGNIAKESCDAIVNAANIYLQNGSGVCGAIFSGAGSRLKEACDEQIRVLGRNLDVSEAVVTEGFDLRSRFIIHSVSPRCMFRWDANIEEKMRMTYRNIFDIADSSGFKSIAIPAMGVGHHHCDPHKCTQIAIDELLHYLHQSNKHLTEIRFVLYTEEMALRYLEIFKESLSKQT